MTISQLGGDDQTILFPIEMNASLTKRAEKKVWQRRFWEHLLRKKKIVKYIWITSITILSNMVMFKVRTTGHKDHFVVPKSRDYIRQIGGKGTFRY